MDKSSHSDDTSVAVTWLQKLIEDPENRIHQLLDASTDGFYITDTGGRYLFTNKVFAQFLGVQSTKDLLGKTAVEVCNQACGNALHSADIAFLETSDDMLKSQEEIEDADATRKKITITRIRAADAAGENQGLLAIVSFEDIQPATSENLLDEHSLLRTLIDNIPDHIYAKDLKNRFILLNKAVAENIGASSCEEIMGKTDFDFFPKDLATQYYEDEMKILNSGEPLVNREEMVVDSHGTVKWASATKVPFKNSAGEIAGLVGINRDITARRHYEEVLKSAKEELERRVQERTADLKSANERLEMRIKQLDFLNHASYELSRYITFKDLIPAICDTFISRFTQAEVCIGNKTAEGYDLLGTTPALGNEKGRYFCEEALNIASDIIQQEPVLIDDWHKNEKLKTLTWPCKTDLPCCVIIPLSADNHIVGMVQVFTTTSFSSQFTEELPLLETLAAHIAVCLVNAFNYKALGEQARVHAELDAARKIQRKLTPQYKPHIPHINLKGAYYPAFEVGGDYLDYFPNEKDEWIIFIADVCGKGIPAALLMTILRSTVRAEGRQRSSAKDLMCAVNAAMTDNLYQNTFITALCIIVNNTGTQMSYARAGHPQLVKFTKKEPPQNISATGVALGLVRDNDEFQATLEEKIIPIKKGDKFLLYTDGLNEAQNNNKDSYGTHQLFDCLSRNSTLDADALVDAIVHDVKLFIEDAAPHDDFTLIAMDIV